VLGTNEEEKKESSTLGVPPSPRNQTPCTPDDSDELVTLSVGLYPNAIRGGVDKVLEIKQSIDAALKEQKVVSHVQAWSERITVTCHQDYSRIVAQVCSDNALCASISEDYSTKVSDFLDEETYLYLTSGKTPKEFKVCRFFVTY
jgi:hypothetical protein